MPVAEDDNLVVVLVGHQGVHGLRAIDDEVEVARRPADGARDADGLLRVLVDKEAGGRERDRRDGAGRLDDA